MSDVPQRIPEERYPRLSEKIHGERNYLRCKDDWTAHAVELEQSVAALEAELTAFTETAEEHDNLRAALVEARRELSQAKADNDQFTKRYIRVAGQRDAALVERDEARRVARTAIAAVKAYSEELNGKPAGHTFDRIVAGWPAPCNHCGATHPSDMVCRKWRGKPPAPVEAAPCVDGLTAPIPTAVTVQPLSRAELVRRRERVSPSPRLEEDGASGGTSHVEPGGSGKDPEQYAGPAVGEWDGDSGDIG